VRGACEVLGIDPMYVANEGKLVAVVPAEVAEQMVAAMRNHPLGREAAIIGEVVADNRGLVAMRTALGAHRIVDMPVGEQLPRIC
jgi:hydrogenase expression/formation protein HypE